MPNKRKRRKDIKKYFCPFCEQRLWRLGTPKHHIFYQSSTEIKKNTGISSKKAKLLHAQKSTYLDKKRWIEAFCCPDHGQLWLLISTHEKSNQYRLAREKDWVRTSRTFDPRIGNPSVSEFTQKMSRGAC